MKKIGLVALFIILIGGAFAIADNHDKKPIVPKPSEIVCTCGCDQKAIQCDKYCPVAR